MDYLHFVIGIFHITTTNILVFVTLKETCLQHALPVALILTLMTGGSLKIMLNWAVLTSGAAVGS
jgi:hypothetical protein